MAESNNSKWVSNIIPVAMPLVALAIGGLTTWLMKIDDRTYDLSSSLPATYVSKDDLEKSMEKLTVSFKDDIERVEDALKQQDEARQKFEQIMLNKADTTHGAIVDLAIKLEKRTKE